MANEASQTIKYSFKAGADLSTKQYLFVKLSAANTVVVCSATTDVPIGVLQNTPPNNGTAEVCIAGISKIIASAGLSAGNLIGTDGTGKATAYTVGTDTTKYCIGQVIDTNTTSGGYVTATVDCTAPGRFS